jgi:DNA-binding response OmpR family regulator
MRLLIVEDDLDGREILTELFRRNGWRVIAVPTTQAAMVVLREGSIDVVITDEDLEGNSGSAMLRAASFEGLLSNVSALMYTSQPEWLDVPPGVRVLHKPLTTASLVHEVNASVGASPDSASRERTPRPRPFSSTSQ